MNISMSLMPYILLITGVIPALFAMRLAKKQNRSVLTSGVVTFALGVTWIGGWVYLAIMNLFAPKPTDN
ncbi:hypothetical protein JQC92_19055 [Shewanella sp. 202IG2-18]|uniref:hypothetical protein n=1 Tax=Parashewanella hymeniacidonis TaxID=2807618 RepID=UPI00195FAD8F|nr:hypothetical protein [Parashewanella hymeniacidonis]MBM7074106.1 hypothetical protein [Parashewanella hymeniacidonis]